MNVLYNNIFAGKVCRIFFCLNWAFFFSWKRAKLTRFTNVAIEQPSCELYNINKRFLNTGFGDPGIVKRNSTLLQPVIIFVLVID